MIEELFNSQLVCMQVKNKNNSAFEKSNHFFSIKNIDFFSISPQSRKPLMRNRIRKSVFLESR